MCGIAALFAKSQDVRAELGELFAPMLSCLGNRGSDSAGFAVYRDPVGPNWTKAVIQHPDPNFAWHLLAEKATESFGTPCHWRSIFNHGLIELETNGGTLRTWLKEKWKEATLVSIGRAIEIYKDAGPPREVIKNFQLASITGTHVIGHTRMATESAVSPIAAHPFSTGRDLCLVHNGSLSNHNELRRKLRREGLQFYTDNDSEVAAGYLTWRISQGHTLEESLEAAAEDLDGFYTFAIGTADGFAVLRDRVACKPAILAETADFAAMASEYRALAHLPGIEAANIWEPEPATVYHWRLDEESILAGRRLLGSKMVQYAG